VGLNPDVIAAFFAGVASILSAAFSIRHARKQERADCAERIAAYERGIEQGLHLQERGD